MYESRKFIGHEEVRPGLRMPSHTGPQHLSFSVTAVCVSAKPEEWYAEVAFGGEVLMTTETTDDYSKATRAAEAALKRKVLEVFGG